MGQKWSLERMRLDFSQENLWNEHSWQHVVAQHAWFVLALFGEEKH